MGLTIRFWVKLAVVLTIGVCLLAGAGMAWKFGVDLTFKMKAGDTLAALLNDDFAALQRDKIATARLQETKRQAEIRQALEAVPFWAWAYRTAFMSLSAAVCIVIVCAGYFLSWGTFRRWSLVDVQIGEYKFRLPYPLLKNPDFAANIPAALQVEYLKAHYPEKALEWSERIMHGLAGRKGFSQLVDITPDAMPALPAAHEPFDVPTFKRLLAQGEFTPGHPMLMGFTLTGEPQHREPADIKSMAVAGWQGSGKTLSMAYILTMCALLYPTSKSYIIDPHRGNKEGLGYLLQPLTKTRRCKIINPLDTPTLLEELNARLDARLEGKEPADDMIILAIDELARLAKMDCFDKLVLFLERCTEETRKANILFFGCSQKWNARHFKGRADIRGSMPSLLVHKMKPSQAGLLLEEGSHEEKKILKTVTQPGTALLSTSHDADPLLVKMPLITPADILKVSEVIVNGNRVCRMTDVDHVTTHLPIADNVVDTLDNVGQPTDNGVSTDQATALSDVAALREIVKKRTAEMDAAGKKILSQAQLARLTNVDEAALSKWKNGQDTLSAAQLDRLRTYLAGQPQPCPTPSNVVPLFPDKS